MIVTLAPYADVRTVPGSARLFELLAPFDGTIDGVVFHIPDGFVTDFASVPKIVENVITNNDPDILRPSLVHDWLYQSKGEPPYSELKFTRAQADAILREAMAFCGATRLRRWTVYFAVRFGGAFVWRTHVVRQLGLRRELRAARAISSTPRPPNQ